MSFTINVKNRPLLLPSPDNNVDYDHERPSLPPLHTFAYSNEYERAHLRDKSVEQILHQGVAAPRTVSETQSPWNSLFSESYSRTSTSSGTWGSRKPSLTFDTIPTSRPFSLSVSSMSSASSTESEPLYAAYKRFNSVSDEVFSRSSSVSSSESTSSCGCENCDPTIEELELQVVSQMSSGSLMSPPTQQPSAALEPVAKPATQFVAIKPSITNPVFNEMPLSSSKTLTGVYRVHKKSSLSKARPRQVQQHITGKSPRQRVGPSCDLCRRKKIKCDAYIQVVEQDVDETGINVDKNTDRVLDDTIISRFVSSEEVADSFKLLLSNGKLIKFRNCSFCEAKGMEATYERGYTKEDTVLHSVLDTMNKKVKKRII